VTKKRDACCAEQDLGNSMRWSLRWPRAHGQQPFAQEPAALTVGPTTLDVVERQVMIEGYVMHLPAREVAILEVLMRHAGRVVSSRELCAAIDQQHHRDDHVARPVRRLTRRMIIHPVQAPLIESVDSAGYRYTPTQRSDPEKP